MNKAPCFHCDENTPVCHGSCERYKEYAEQQEQRRNAERRASMCYAYISESAKRRKKQNYREPKIGAK